jgi:hypothetical protein
MPRLCPTDGRLPALLHDQDWVITGTQACALGLTRRAVYDRTRRSEWQRLLPGVYLAHPGEPTRRQRLIASLLYAGPAAAIDADDACVFHGLKAVTVDEDDQVRVVVPQMDPARDSGFVRVRRTSTPILTVATQRLRYLEPAAAAIAAARVRTSERRVLAILADAVQRGITTPQDLVRAHVQGPPRNAGPTSAALDHLRAGVQSAPEGEFRLLAEASLVLPRLLYNRRLKLPGGELIIPDALALDAGLVHETNGRRAHARDDLFEDMQARHEIMTTAGLTVLHSAPRRLHRNGRDVIVAFERCYSRLAGRGLPPGVELLPDRGR